MLINNIDINTFGAVLSDKQIQSANININNNWSSKALDYIVTSKNVQFKSIKLTINFIASTEEEILNNISNFYALLQDRCTIKFDDIDFFYDCIYVSQGSSGDLTKYTNDNYEAVINLLSGYSYKSAVTESIDNMLSNTINVPGNLPTPAIVTLTMPIDTVSTTITGLSDKPITINNLKSNIPVVINGEDITVLQGDINKFNDCDIWNFPVLQPGNNIITVDNSNSTIQIQYKPRFI